MPRVCITVHGKNAQPYRFSLERKVVRLGRASDNDIVIDCPSVSSHHCEMRRVEGGYILKDAGSTNGIKLEGDKMEIIDLENGQEILVGDAAMDFELTSEELRDLSKEDRKLQQSAQLPAAKKKSADSRRPTPAPAAPSAGPTGPPGRGITPLASAQDQGTGAKFAITVGFLFLAVIAFYLGLASGHKSKHPTTKGLWEDMFGDGPLPEKRK